MYSPAIKSMLSNLTQLFDIGRGDLSKARNLIYLCAVILVVSCSILAIFDRALAWVAIIIVQVILCVGSCFKLLSFVEYEDRKGHEPLEMERVMNPLNNAETAVRIALCLILVIGARGYWTALGTTVPFIVYDLWFRRLKRVDATSLWKDVVFFKREAQWRVAAEVLAFFIVLASMIMSLIGSLLSRSYR
jgi:hypothetical protein